LSYIPNFSLFFNIIIIVIFVLALIIIKNKKSLLLNTAFTKHFVQLTYMTEPNMHLAI